MRTKLDNIHEEIKEIKENSKESRKEIKDGMS